MCDRLIEMIMNSRTPLISRPIAKTIAEDLIKDGVIVPPCKVGDTVYLVEYSRLTGDGYVLKNHVEAFTVQDGLVYVYYSDPLGRLFKRLPGVSAFFTREEAERALEGGV